MLTSIRGRAMGSVPLEEWQHRAAEIKERFAGSGRPSLFSSNAMADLAPEFAELIQTIARGRSYADETLDLKTRALCTVACLVGLGEPRYIENWVSNAMSVGATRRDRRADGAAVHVHRHPQGGSRFRRRGRRLRSSGADRGARIAVGAVPSTATWGRQPSTPPRPLPLTRSPSPKTSVSDQRHALRVAWGGRLHAGYGRAHWPKK